MARACLKLHGVEGRCHRREGGESRRDVYLRIAAFLEELLAEPPAEEIALVASGGERLRGRGTPAGLREYGSR